MRTEQCNGYGKGGGEAAAGKAVSTHGPTTSIMHKREIGPHY